MMRPTYDLAWDFIRLSDVIRVMQRAHVAIPRSMQHELREIRYQLDRALFVNDLRNRRYTARYRAFLARVVVRVL